MAQGDLNTVESKSISIRVLLAAVVLAALVFAWTAMRRQIGDMIAGLTAAADPAAAQMADIALSMAPSDPLALLLKATAERKIFTSAESVSPLPIFEDTVRSSPSDFRWWIELGRAYEQAGRPVQAEAAFKQALSLAPTYTFPRWQIGNFYLRQERFDEAFVELKKATENNQTYREQVFSLAWDYFNKDPAKVEQFAADQPDVHASLALFYAQRGFAADSLRNWNLLSDQQKAEHPQIFHVITQGFYERRFFPQALEFSRQLGVDPDAKPEMVTNAGFEKPIGNPEDTYFGWRVYGGESKVVVATDSAVHHEGSRSIRIGFKNYNKPELFQLGQNVVVEPGRSYRLRFWLRTENLRSGGMPQLQVVNGNDDKIITLSAAYPAGTTDWQQMTVDFSAPDNCNGIVIRTVRGYCGQDCPISGTIWYDDFALSRQ